MSGKERIKTLQHKYLHVLVFLRQGALACFHLSRQVYKLQTTNKIKLAFYFTTFMKVGHTMIWHYFIITSILPNLCILLNFSITPYNNKRQISLDEVCMYAYYIFSLMKNCILFQVDSLEFPGQKHKWLLTQLLLKGKNKAHETLLDDLAKSLYLLGKTI